MGDFGFRNALRRHWLQNPACHSGHDNCAGVFAAVLMNFWMSGADTVPVASFTISTVL